MIHTVHYIPLDPLEYPFINIPWKTPGFHGPKGDVESHDVATGHHCLGGGGLLRGHWCHETAGLGGSLEQRWRVGSKHLGISMEKYRDVWHIWYYMIYDIRYTFIYIYTCTYHIWHHTIVIYLGGNGISIVIYDIWWYKVDMKFNIIGKNIL